MPESKRRKPKSVSPTVATTGKKEESSPTWYVAVMAGLMAVGVILVLVRFIGQLNQLVMIVGLVFIAAGFLMTTRYH